GSTVGNGVRKGCGSLAGRIFYGWIIAGTILTVWALSIGPRQSFSVFLLPFVEEFGSNRSVVSGVFSVHMALYAVGGWGLGILVDRVGPKRIIAWSTAGWALVLVATGWLSGVWQLYLVYGFLGGIATGGLAYVANNALISRWFIRYRGVATGLAQAGVPLGAAIYGSLGQLGVATMGWRGTHVAFGLVVLVVAVPLIALVHRDDPKEMGLLPDGRPSGAESGPRRERHAGHAGAGLPRGYWAIFGANALRGLTMYAILVHQVAYLVDVGFSRLAAASYFSTAALLAIAGGLAAGAISDRIGRLRTYGGLAGLFAVGYLSLLLTRHPSHTLPLWVFVVSTGVATGGVGPVFTAFLTDRLQGPRLGFLLGLQNIGFGAGATLAPYLAGAAFDILGSYTLVFILMAAAIVGSSLIASATARRLSPSSR
ncbi:MAG: MFS transporter, partial [Zetaproteobacteria bacterium]